jgi:hypothetical protein
MADKNWIQGPLDANAKAIGFNGVPLLLVADLPEGGFVQIINGENPIAMPTPGPQCMPGTMLLLVPVEVAAHLRQGMKQAEAEQLKQLGKPFAIGGVPVGPSVFQNREKLLDN